MNKKLVIASILLSLISIAFWLAYTVLDGNYQSAMDPIRIKHAQEIASVVHEYADKTGHLPFQELAGEKPFMVILGHSSREEDHFAQDPVLQKGGTWANGSDLESVLSKALKRPIKLPRDPQKVATYAPNVYVYFVSGKQMEVAVHLKFPNDYAVEYEWHGEQFYSYTLCYDFDVKR